MSMLRCCWIGERDVLYCCWVGDGGVNILGEREGEEEGVAGD